jgi:hypothetical protein|eukprot:COSAG01_NODE_3197_length_6430_cov_36.427263_2_plen_104_part_00
MGPSLPLLLICAICSAAAAFSNIASLRALPDRSILIADARGVAKVVLLVSPFLAVVSCMYSLVFMIFFTDQGALRVLSLDWRNGGETLLCATYCAFLVLCSAR